MQKAHHREPPALWYREPLVWMVIAIPASSVVFGIFMLVVSIQSYDGLLVDDYYKRGMEINRVLDRDRAAARHGMSAQVRLTGGIPAAWNPPATGAEHDRVPRQESYVKAFRPVSLGIIDLPAAKGTLTLRATQIPGPEALEFRLLTLRRLPAE